MDKISIILPIYNVEKYLEKCVSSLLNQTYKNFEIILIDDGSTDGSGKICDNLEKTDVRIKCIHKKNGGVSSARNKGIISSTGKYICFVDPDDYVEATFLEELYALMSKDDGDTIAVCCYNRIENDNIKESEKKEFDKSEVFSMTPEDFFKRVLLEDDLGGGVCWNKMYSSKLLKNNLFDEKISVGEDLKFIYCIYRKVDNFNITRKKLYNSVLRHGSLSKTYKESNLKKEQELCKEILDGINKNNKELYLCALRRYICALSYLVIYSENYKKYKKEINFGRKNFYKIFLFKKVKANEKVYFFLKLFLPGIYIYLKRRKDEKSIS